MFTRAGTPASAYVLTAVLVMGLFLRLLWIQDIPPGLNSDELLKAYDGASVWRTGKDHHGEANSLFFRQSGEYSPPLYIYFSGLFSAVWGISALTVRLPSILLGTLSILLTYFFVKHLFNRPCALLAAAFTAFSPWNIFYSRLGWEAILQVPLQLFGFWWFFLWLDAKKPRHLWIAVVSLALCFYTYPTERLFIPMMMSVLAAVSYPTLIQHWRQTLTGLAVFVLLLLPTLLMYLYHPQEMQARWMFLSVWNRPDGWILFLTQWLQHLSPQFLFITGSSFGMQGGMALLVLTPFFYVGLWVCLRRRNPADVLLIAWFLCFAIPAALTYDRYDPNSMPNSLRTTCGMPLLEIISSIGIHSVYTWIPAARMKHCFSILLTALLVINGWVVFQDYYTDYGKRTFTVSHYGLDELVTYIETHQARYDKVVISHKIGLHPITVAAFTQPDPVPFSKQDYSKYVLPFYHYVPTYHDWGTEEYERYGIINRWYYQGAGKLLLAAKAGEIQGETPIHVIYYPHGEPAYELYEVHR